MPETPTSSARKWWALASIGLGVFMSTLDVSIVNISLPTLVHELGTSFATIQWVVLSYLLVITTLMLSVARLGDMAGRKRLYNLGLVLFTLGSLLCGLAPGIGWLIGFRALQGTGAVMMTALGTAIITEIFPASERGRALGINGAIVSIGIALGPTIGGILIGTVGWRSVFLVNVPVGIVASVMVARLIPPSSAARSGQRFDFAGALILLLTLSCYALGMTLGQEFGFGQAHVIGLLALAGAGLAAFLAVQLRVSQPMVDLGLFRNTLFGINLLMGFLVFIMIGGFFIFPFFLELVQGYRTEQVGLLMATFPIMMGLTAPISGALSDRFGSRVISLIGLVLIATACLLIGTLSADTTALGYVLRIVPLGIGVGMFNSPNNSAIMGAVPRERLGVASGLLALTRTLGQMTGLPLIGAIFTLQVVRAGGLAAGADVTGAAPAALVAGVQGTFHIVAAIILLSTVLAAAALWLDARQNRAANQRQLETAASAAEPAPEAPPAPPAPQRGPTR